MDIQYTQHSSTDLRIWETPCFKASVISLITITAISCIIIGALAFAGGKFGAIGTTGGRNMMIAGGSLLAVELVVLLIKARGEVLSNENAEKYKKHLKANEFFFYRGNNAQGYQKMIMSKPFGEEARSLYAEFNLDAIEEKTRVTLKELKKREEEDQNGQNFNSLSKNNFKCIHFKN